MLVEFMLLGVLAQLPDVRPEYICRNARSVVLPAERGRAYETCVNEERAARDTLQQKWKLASSEARENCAVPDATQPSYVEILTCLDLQPGGGFLRFPPRGR